MNNKRLTTNRESEETVSVDRNLLLEKIENLLAKPSNFEVKEDGRIFIISENRYYSNKNKLQVTVERLDGTILHTFDSIKECLEKLNISKSLWSRSVQIRVYLLILRVNYYTLKDLINRLKLKLLY